MKMKLDLLSKYRSELMGVATIWVMLFHFRANFHAAPLDIISSIGYGGVDMFLFLSGFGLFCSFCKDKNIKNFYKKRFLRVYPLYLFVIIVASILSNNYNLLSILMKSIGVGYFMPFISDAFYEWYVPTILFLYFSFPLIYKLLNINVVKMGGVMIGIGILFTGVLIGMQKGTIILSVSRFPIFVMGCMTGYYFVNKSTLRGIPLLCILSICTMISEIIIVNHFNNEFLWRNAVYWLPFIVITPGLCFTLCGLFQKINSYGISNLKFIGSLSLEAYLIHVICLGYFRDWCKSFVGDSFIKLWLAFFLFLTIILTLSFILHKIYVLAIYGRTISKY